MPDAELTARQYDAMGTAYQAQSEGGSWNAYHERPAIIELIGDPGGLRVLEAGCGPGTLTDWLVRQGATVTAIDISPEMARLARARTGGRADIVVADLGQPLTLAADASRDLVVASLSLHYLADWAPVLAEFRRVLTRDGAVVFSVYHPSFSWQFHNPDDYFDTREVTETWRLGGGGNFPVTLWKRPLTAMTAAISDSGFLIDQLTEPQPVPELEQRDPEDYRWLRKNPSFLLFRLVKRH